MKQYESIKQIPNNQLGCVDDLVYFNDSNGITHIVEVEDQEINEESLKKIGFVKNEFNIHYELSVWWCGKSIYLDVYGNISDTSCATIEDVKQLINFLK